MSDTPAMNPPTGPEPTEPEPTEPAPAHEVTPGEEGAMEDTYRNTRAEPAPDPDEGQG